MIIASHYAIAIVLMIPSARDPYSGGRTAFLETGV